MATITYIDYQNFLFEFKEGMGELFPRDTFYVYGSSNGLSENFIPGKGYSDIDGGILLDSNVITDKERYRDLTLLFAETMRGKNIGTDFNILDSQSSKDGRFLSYDKTLTSLLKQRAIIHSGPENLSLLNGFLYKHPKLQSSSMNFCGPNSVRSNLFHLENDFYIKSPSDFEEKNVKSLKKVLNLSRNLIWLVGHEDFDLIESRQRSINQLSSVLKGFDPYNLNELNKIYRSREKSSLNFRGLESSFTILSSALTEMEKIIDCYIETFPKPNEREVKH